ncbi:5-formyltetrahydrofolate cyclo-ligase [Dermatobacter hominis]|uniref:5-formyltetrahydrofolate cyclo-ligase n=1 Tax=Dermatobacter hominis TaxID=2884263 RepID=UPI001D1204D6|nr:5-formyltetrahydrofolate cyclo-ligase [Dermatobacter hominis]UDY37895.1 5-formyltetrahydrofolate cyclo-ligase [Dermatobacter hominis]
MTAPAPAPPPSDPDAADAFAAARRRGRSARSAMAPEQRAVATAAVHRALVALDELRAPTGSGRVALSRALPGELDLGAAAEDLRRRGWTTWLPVVDPDPPAGAPSMAFREWRPEDTLVVGAFRIEEPPADGRPDVAAEALDVVVVPCLAVDLDGTRVGFGAGYYDRALADRRRRPLVVVAAFDAQVEPALLPRRPWDVPGDVVVTDRRTVRTGRR